ncbi:MAG: acetyl-CoA carboxylase, biotin carboxyl carrier protein [Dehalococcoidia bacterium]|nr:MAG: acetyl-CoA carboxylase, biotin carboxyl carrier protein [Dehalococcoidia bacterium]
MADRGRADPFAYLAGEATEILRLLANSDVDEFELERDGHRLLVRRSLRAVSTPPTQLSESPSPEPTSEKTFLLTSPVVGWFRRGATVDGPPLAEVGQSVEPGQRLAVIEAVQVVHDVIAERPGVIVEALVADGEGVGYGQPLFRLREPDA